MAAAAISRVVLTRRLPEAALAALRRRANTALSIWDSDEPMPRAELLREVSRDGGAAAVLCMLSDKIDAEVFNAAGPSLRVVSTLSVGYSHVDVPAATSKGVRIGFTPDVLTDATADLAVTLLLATARRIPEAVRAAGDGSWRSWQPFWLTGKAVAGSTVGIVGAGRIGSAVARRLGLGFGCKILYAGRSRRPELEAEVGAAHVPLEELLPRSDFVVLLCALTPETRGLLGYERLTAMKVDAVLVNASRGEVVDQDALVRVLRERPGFRAGLDVTTPEPLPLDSPLLALPNAVVLPHIGSATTACRTAMVELAAANVAAALDGADMPAEVPETKAARTLATAARGGGGSA